MTTVTTILRTSLVGIFVVSTGVSAQVSHDQKVQDPQQADVCPFEEMKQQAGVINTDLYRMRLSGKTEAHPDVVSIRKTKEKLLASLRAASGPCNKAEINGVIALLESDGPGAPVPAGPQGQERKSDTNLLQCRVDAANATKKAEAYNRQFLSNRPLTDDQKTLLADVEARALGLQEQCRLLEEHIKCKNEMSKIELDIRQGSLEGQRNRLEKKLLTKASECGVAL